MTLLEMLTDLYDKTGYDSGTTQATVHINRSKRWLNEIQKMILVKKGYSSLRRGTLSFSTVANLEFIPLPLSATRLYSLVDRTNHRPLDDLSLRDLRRLDPGLTQSAANPYGYVVLNYASPVARHPATTGVWASSTNAGDTTQTIRMTYIDSSGLPRSASATLTGTSRVQIGALATIVQITSLSLSAAGLGSVSVFDAASGGNTLGIIVVGTTNSIYTLLQIYPTPTAVITLHADVDLVIPTLTNDTDVPLLPADWDWLLVKGAEYMEWKRKEQWDLYRATKTEFNEGMRDLRMWIIRQTESPGRLGFSRLGPWFPEGS